MQMSPSSIADPSLEDRFHTLFGAGVQFQRPLSESGLGARVNGLDLTEPLAPAQVDLLLDTLAHCRLFTVAGQDLERFSSRRSSASQIIGARRSPILELPARRQTGPAGRRQRRRHLIPALCGPAGRGGRLDAARPGLLPAARIACRPGRHQPAGPERGRRPSLKAGGTWHTDIEYEPLPIYVSMFLVHFAPLARDASNGQWVEPPVDDGAPAPYFPGSDDELMARRKCLPLNGETAFTDTAAAFAALPADERAKLEAVRVRRRLNAGDEGWLAPLVRTDPRSGLKSLHSPVWASRPGIRPSIEVDGRSPEDSRAFLDRLEAHILQPRFRYDHVHTQGDVTVWNNYMTLHNSPPIKIGIDSVDDARLLYRLSCKGEPALTLPRQDDPTWIAAHVAGDYRSPPEIVGTQA